MPFQQPLGPRSAREVWTRQIRWARLRRVTFPLFFAPEILSGVALPLIAGAYAAVMSGLSVAAVVGVLLVLWYGSELALARTAGWHMSVRLPLAMLVRDCLILPMWAYAWIGRNVVWRGNAMCIRSQATMNLQDRPSGV